LDGSSVEGPFDYTEEALQSALVYLTCNPDFCKCKGSNKEVDVRPEEMKNVMDTCPRGKMNRCLCHDNEVAKFPFDIRTFYFDCRPKRVRKMHCVICKERTARILMVI
jgi:hypothetical protein